jgi:hypothetical protein
LVLKFITDKIIIMNWGHKILIVYAVFVAGILFLVFKSSSQKMDLVTTDYYAKELKYQQKIDETNRVNALSAPVLYEIKNSEMVIHFPKDFSGKKLSGEAVLYCPSDENKDVKYPFSIQDAPVIIPLPPVHKGLYELHLTWQTGGYNYYFEKKIVI